MSGIHFLLIGVALIGLLPLTVILIRKRIADNILANGVTAQATVYHLQTSARMTHEIVHYQFQDAGRGTFKGRLTVAPGKYKINDQIEIYYLQDNPKRNTVRGAWGSKFIIGFGIVIALVVWFMVYKLFEMVREGQI